VQKGLLQVYHPAEANYRMQLPEDLRNQGPLDLILRLERCGGMLLDVSKMSNAWRFFLYNFSKSVTISCIIIVSMGFIVETYITRDNLEEFAESFSLLITQTKNSVKLIALFVHRKKVLDIIKNAGQNFFIHEKDLSPEESSLICRYLRRARRFTFIFWVQWGLCLLSQSASMRTADNSVREMPIKMWVPFDTTQSPFYELGYAYNILSCIIVSWYVALTDSLFFVVIIQTTAQFELLGHSLRTHGRNYEGIRQNAHTTCCMSSLERFKVRRLLRQCTSETL
jgi:hypothetical protein